MKKLDVLLAFPECHRRGGVERIMYECGCFLAQRNHNVQILANEVDPKMSSLANITVRDANVKNTAWFLNGLRYYITASRQLQKLNYDVLNTHGCVAPVGGVPWVQSVHRAWLEVSQSLRPNQIQRVRQRLNPLHPILLMLEREHFAKRQYSKVIVTTADVQRDLERLYSVPHHDVEVVPNGFNPSEFNIEKRLNQRSRMRAQLGMTDDTFVLLFAANELERKGFYTLVRAMSRLRETKVVVLVVGRYDTVEAQKVVNVHQLDNQIRLCGSTRNIAEFHSAADAFVLPTKYEAFCLAILEALGSGLPVITTRVPGAYNAIVENVNGLLLDNPEDDYGLAKCIRSLLESFQDGFQATDIAQTVECYQWPSVLIKYEQILIENAGS
jgi:UDP-glucose:(heptosyl)LPS alpha-1,3-glucosyltransferase